VNARAGFAGAWLLLTSLVAIGLGGCADAVNYGDPYGPRFAGAPPAPPMSCGVSRDSVRVASWNAAYAEHVEGLLGLLAFDAALRRADIVVLQEVDEVASERIAQALGLYWVYYPATHHPVPAQRFGNALLSCWPIEEDGKLPLPHLSWTRRAQRAAVLGTVRIGTQPVRVVALHLATPLEVGPRSQREQAETVLAAVRGWTRVIVAGDFNRPDLGRIFEADGFSWATRGLGPTFYALGLDHIVARGFVAVARGRIQGKGISDHRAVWADLTFSSSAR